MSAVSVGQSTSRQSTAPVPLGTRRLTVQRSRGSEAGARRAVQGGDHGEPRLREHAARPRSGHRPGPRERDSGKRSPRAWSGQRPVMDRGFSISRIASWSPGPVSERSPEVQQENLCRRGRSLRLRRCGVHQGCFGYAPRHGPAVHSGVLPTEEIRLMQVGRSIPQCCNPHHTMICIDLAIRE